ncbi:MAG: ATP-binding protein, partial [Rubrobacter sp.]|nr:ATP-binding protein [Rubrobacter sp.]
GLTLAPALEGRGRIRGDKARMEQAVMALVDNAAKYAPRGSRVYLSAEKKKGGLRIRVEDEGPGIPEDKLPHIFERFYRVDKARSRKQGGAGLGLSIARTIAEVHGGRIEAENTKGGARMTLYLPLSAEAANADQKVGQGKS